MLFPQNSFRKGLLIYKKVKSIFGNNQTYINDLDF